MEQSKDSIIIKGKEFVPFLKFEVIQKRTKEIAAQIT
jgi:hypothetical protein